jgi:predicted flap endonuclease-1-like 5' DNA nuclease
MEASEEMTAEVPSAPVAETTMEHTSEATAEPVTEPTAMASEENTAEVTEEAKPAKAKAEKSETKVAKPKAEPKAKAVKETETADETNAEAGTSGKTDAKDNLVIIEGIGPKIAELLNAGGIHTFDELANSSVTSLREILDNAGSKFKMHDPGTWAQQAKLAAEGNMDKLKELQESLKAGKAEK